MFNRHRQEAQVAYSQLLLFYGEILGSNGTASEEVQARRDGISLLIMQFLCQCAPEERFSFTEFPSIIYNTAAADIFRPEKALAAFLNIEQYLLLLCLMPWKQEYHKIKKFGGFYRSKIEYHLRDVETIFKLVGFEENKYGGLALTSILDTTRLQEVAFECFLASVECKIIGSVCLQGVKISITPLMVIEIRSHHSGTDDYILSLVERQHSKKVNSNESDGVIVKSSDKNKKGLDQSCNAPFRNKLEGYMRTAKQHSSVDTIDIPYIDEDVNKEVEFTKGTLDDHLMASLQIVGDEEVKPAKAVDHSQVNAGGSQEWSFVREGLERKHGKKYFDGLRKDILVESEDKSDQRSYPTFDKSKTVSAVVRPALIPTSPEPCSPHPTVDSAYLSQSTIYPPTIVSRQGPPMRMVSPTVRHTDVVIRKSPEMYSEAKPDFSKTVPLMRRQPRGISEEASRSYPGISPLPVYTSTPVPQDMGNIKMCLKQRPSVPVNSNEFQVPENKAEQPPPPNVKKIYGSNLPSAAADTQGLTNSSASNKNRLRSSGYGSNLTTSAANSQGLTNSSASNKSRSRSMPVSNISSGAAMKDKWSCRHCTYINSLDSIVCDICSKTRDGQLEMDSPSAGDVSKVCSKCTLENKSGSIMCHACGNELSAVHTVV